MSHRAKLAALTGALVALAAPRGARADSGDASAASASSPRVALVLDGDCAGEATATEKIFAIELDARVVPSAPDVTTARVRLATAPAAHRPGRARGRSFARVRRDVRVAATSRRRGVVSSRLAASSCTSVAAIPRTRTVSS